MILCLPIICTNNKIQEQKIDSQLIKIKNKVIVWERAGFLLFPIIKEEKREHPFEDDLQPLNTAYNLLLCKHLTPYY